jgi:RNA polymerase sigma-70 factor (ECF subfamily)
VADELDELTLERARAGEAAALARLVRCYERPVFALVSRLLCGHSQLSVDDLAQESFVRILRGIHRFDPRGPARLSTWILTVATRACLNGLRARRHQLLLPRSAPPHSHDGADQAASPEEITLGRERHGRVTRAMAALPEEMRAVLVLRAFHDLDYPEIAAALDLEVGTVKSRLSRARAALREALDRPERPPPAGLLPRHRNSHHRRWSDGQLDVDDRRDKEQAS